MDVNIILSAGILVVGYLAWVQATYREKGDIEEESVARFEDRKFEDDDVSVIIEEISIHVNNIYLRNKEKTMFEKLRDNVLPYGKFRGRTRFCMRVQDVPKGEKLPIDNTINKLSDWDIVEVRCSPQENEDYERLDLLFDTTDSDTIRNHISDIGDILGRLIRSNNHFSTKEIPKEINDSKVIEVNEKHEIPPEIQIDKIFKQFKRRVGITYSHPESPLHIETHRDLMEWVYTYGLLCTLNFENSKEIFESIWYQREASTDYGTSEQYIYEAGAFYIIMDYIFEDADSSIMSKQERREITDTIKESKYNLPPPQRLLLNHITNNTTVSEQFNRYDDQISDHVRDLVSDNENIFEKVNITGNRYSNPILRRAACVFLYTYNDYVSVES